MRSCKSYTLFTLLIACVAGNSFAEISESDNTRDKQPNILFIMSDDHAAHAISAYKSRLSKVAPTPNIDRLAKEGALFKNAFCTNAICALSRASILTGQYAHTNGVFDLFGVIKPADQTLAIEFGKAGYDTAMIGKWHLKVEPAAFNYYSVLGGQGKYFNPVFRVPAGLSKIWPRCRC